jgi:PAS domain S-box-containing protein
LQHSLQVTIWISVLIISTLSIFSISVRLLNIPGLNSPGSAWSAMRPISAACFLLSALCVVLIRAHTPIILRFWIPKALTAVLFLVSLVTAIDSLNILTKVYDPALASTPLYNFFLSPANRMQPLAAFIFMFFGITLFLLSGKTKRAIAFGHLLMIPAALAVYFIPVSQILDIRSIAEFYDMREAYITGIAFFALSAAVLFIRPETWLMKVFTSRNMGGMFARRILPALLVLPVIIAWLTLKGEREGIFDSEAGVLFVAMAYTLCFVWLIWTTARSVNRIDEKRRFSDEALKRSYAELDIKVNERTDELLRLNNMLETEISDRKKAQDKVDSERRRFYELLELIPSYLILLTPDYRVSYANRFFRERFGEDRGRCCYEYLFNRTEPCEDCITFNVFKDNKPHTWEWTGPDGHIYSIFDFPFEDSDGSPLIMEMGIDVTGLKNAEEELRKINAELEERVYARTEELLKSEQKYRLLFEKMAEGFAYHEIILDQYGKPCDYRFLSINPAFEKQTGLKAETVIGKRVSEVLPDLEEYWIEAYGKVAMEGENLEFENFSSELNRWFMVRAFCPMPGFFAVIFENITDRIIAEKELNSTKNYLENLINHANAPIIVWNIDTEIELFNHAFEHLTGYSSSEVLGKKLDFLFPEDSMEESLKMIGYSLTKNWETIEIPILTKDKQIRTILWNSANIYDSDGKRLLSVIAQGNDITERIKAEQAVIESKAKLDMALENASIGVWEWDPGNDSFTVGQEAEQNVGNQIRK